MKNVFQHIISAITALAFLSACTNSNEGSDGGNVLVRVGQSALTISELRSAIPVGTEPEDSARLAQSYINRWIDTHLITDIVAPSIPEIDEIDRMTQQYRLSLIEDAYRSRMYKQNGDDVIPDDTLRAYYNQTKDNLKLKSPVIKGVFLKFAENSEDLKEARRLFKSSKQADIDKLEKIAFDGAVHYDYFRDRWVDWQQMMALIPYDFGSDPLTYPGSHTTTDYTSDGFTYLLQITDYQPAGAGMPYEYARDRIRDAILYEHRKKYDSHLLEQLREDALESGKLKIY